MFNAAGMALILQCGITAAAVVIFVFTLPLGLECRSLGYIAYGGISIIIMFLNIISTVLARISETREGRLTVVKGSAAFIAIALRRFSFVIALLNGTGLIILSCLQFANVLDNCFCYAKIIGAGPLTVFSSQSSATIMKISRIAAILLSAVVMSIYMGFLRLMTLLPDDISNR